MSSNIITNRTVKPYIEMHDFYPGFKLEEECFAKAIIKDMNESRSKKKGQGKSDLNQEPLTWPHEKSVKQTSYEAFLEEVINPKTGQFYPQKNKDRAAIKNTGATYYITEIYRIRRASGEEFLYSKGIVYAYDSRGNPVNHSISRPETWLKTNFNYKTDINYNTKQLEEILQGPSSSEEVYTMPFNKENLKELYDRRQNDLVNFVVKDEQTGKAFQVKDVTGNVTKSYELLRDKSFDYLFGAEFIPKEIKAELRQEAVAQGIIRGGAGDYNQAPSSGATTPKNTYQ